MVILPTWTPLSIAFNIFIALVLFLPTISELAHHSITRYSKFRTGRGISSRQGMFIIYSMPGVVSFFFASRYLSQASMLQWALFLAITLHFVKRCLEVLYVHQYSGPIDLFSVYAIASFYCFITGYAGYLHNQTIPAPDALFQAGLGIYVLGEVGNFWHHMLLARLRLKNRQYFIPRGGLFELVACPHYLFEILAWLGIALMSRHLFLYLVAVAMTAYLVQRALKTQNWYREHFPNYPKNRKALFPFVL